MLRQFGGFIYRNILKRILFLFPADAVHLFFLNAGRRIGKIEFVKKQYRRFLRFDNPILEQTVCGLKFNNPIGLSAGFDYNADLVEVLPCIGFGFHTIGTLTHESYAGNTPPMLGRLPKSKSLIVNKGFRNNGVSKVLTGVSPRNGQAIRGVSIGSTNKDYLNFDGMIVDLISGFADAEKFDNFDYYELNISCPNLLNQANLDNQLSAPSGLLTALRELDKLNLARPVFIKMPLEKSTREIDALLEIAKDFSFISGLIFSNLAKDRTNPAFNRAEVDGAGVGNFSGKPVEKRSNELLEHAYRTYRNRFVLIGAGGVFTAEDAYKKILFGASLVQLITGMIYMGPQQIGIINKRLAKLLKGDGYKNITDAVGASVI